MKKSIFLLWVAGTLMSTMVGCSQGPYPGFDKSESGLYYNFLNKTKKSQHLKLAI